MVIIVYDSLLAMISLNLNGILDLSAQYYGSVLFSIVVMLFYFIYVLVWVRPFRLFELYKIHNIFRAIALCILPVNKYAGIVLLDLFDLFFFVVDLVLYRHEKLSVKVYVVEKILTLIALNTAIFATESLSLLVVAGLCMAGIFIIKLYYTGTTMK